MLTFSLKISLSNVTSFLCLLVSWDACWYYRYSHVTRFYSFEKNEEGVCFCPTVSLLGRDCLWRLGLLQALSPAFGEKAGRNTPGAGPLLACFCVSSTLLD